MNKRVIVIGSGLAGSEAAWQLAERGIAVDLYEMRPTKQTPAHNTAYCAELVCSNSFRSDDHEYNAVGLLHYELRQLKSLIMQSADKNALPAGSALAVDRDGFAATVTENLQNHPLITIHYQEVTDLSSFANEPIIIATGPLTSDALSQQIIKLTGQEHLAFFDAIAPIVHHHSIDMSIAWRQSRYDRVQSQDSEGDYINCPLNKSEYQNFLEALLAADTTDFKEWEKDTPYFEGCLPIEVIAHRGPDTLRFGCMKPVGLSNPHHQEAPYAVVQLRQDNKQGSLYNIVGFQTKMRYGEQIKVLRLIPGLQDAEFARLGGIHRNIFIRSPALLSNDLSLKNYPNIHFAGQIIGCEGYVESAAMGWLTGYILSQKLQHEPFELPGRNTAIGSLHSHITKEAEQDSFQPMNINFGLFPQNTAPFKGRSGKKQRAAFYTERAKEEINKFIKNIK